MKPFVAADHVRSGPHLFHKDEMVALDDAVRISGVSRRTLYNWMAKGKIEHTRTAGGGIRIKVGSLFTNWPGVPAVPAGSNLKETIENG